MRNRFALAALALSLAIGACGKDSPTTAPDAQRAPEFQQGSKLLKNIPVTATAADGRVFTGKVTITRFDAVPTAADPTRATVVVSGKLQLQGAGVQEFSNVPVMVTDASAAGLLRIAPTFLQATCSILDLDIGAIHLDLLGLVVDLAPVHLDITGQTGPGNLLGNLLCALTGILDPGGVGPLTDLINLLTQINNILAGL